MNSKIRILAESSIMIALASVLSLLKLAELPYGGSITLASMLPIVVIAYRHGTKIGLLCGLAYGVIQQLLGLNNLSYVTTWYSVLAVILLDYILAFAVIGFAGIFRKSDDKASQSASMVYGVAFVCLVRYIMHTVSGATVWAGLSIPNNAAILYSLSYNATYMVPETIILLVVTAYVSSIIDFRKEKPTRMKREYIDKVSLFCCMFAALPLVAGGIVATVYIFSKLQNPDSGEFDITLLSGNMLVPSIALAIGAVMTFGLFLAAYLREKNKTSEAD